VGRLKTQCLIQQNTDVNEAEDKEFVLFRDFTQRRMAAQERLYGTAILHWVKSQKFSDVIYTPEGR
jgi:hypothetical protein